MATIVYHYVIIYVVISLFHCLAIILEIWIILSLFWKSGNLEIDKLLNFKAIQIVQINTEFRLVYWKVLVITDNTLSHISCRFSQ